MLDTAWGRTMHSVENRGIHHWAAARKDSVRHICWFIWGHIEMLHLFCYPGENLWFTSRRKTKGSTVQKQTIFVFFNFSFYRPLTHPVINFIPQLLITNLLVSLSRYSFVGAARRLNNIESGRFPRCSCPSRCTFQFSLWSRPGPHLPQQEGRKFSRSDRKLPIAWVCTT